MASPTNEQLRELLVGLGFTPGRRTNKNHRVFRHSASGCVFLLPDNKSPDAARPADLVGLKAHLAYQGLLDEEAFDHFVQQGELPAKTT